MRPLQNPPTVNGILFAHKISIQRLGFGPILQPSRVGGGIAASDWVRSFWKEVDFGVHYRDETIKKRVVSLRVFNQMPPIDADDDPLASQSVSKADGHIVNPRREP